jgi:arylsulfatase A-like enzyme
MTTPALAFALLASLLSVALAADSPKRPNILIIYVDDLARGDVGAFGCPDPGTENIDRLADQGMRLLNAYTHNAPCSPSRTALMMGAYTQRWGKYGLSRGVPIPDDKPTLAETLRDAGYHTGFIGFEKWDIGRWDQGALDRGFMEAARQTPRRKPGEGNESGSWYVGVDGSYLTESEGDYAIDFISRHGRTEQPFFLYYVPLAVHTPLHEVPEKYLRQLYPDHEGKWEPRQYLRGTLLALDIQIGRMLDQLDKMGIADETLVIFGSDNGGDPAAQHRPDPYRGGKRGVNRSNLQWEGNYRMPTIVSWPGTLPAGKSYDGMASTIDFYATAAAVAETPLPKHCEGVNLLPLLLKKQQPDPDRILFWNTHGSEIARWKQWRIVNFRDGGWRLYDIEADPGETTDLGMEKPEILKEIRARYDAWLAEMADPVNPVRPPDEVYPHSAFGRHARRPFGTGWITVDEWDKIKDDPTQWGESFARERMLKEMGK